MKKLIPFILIGFVFLTSCTEDDPVIISFDNPEIDFRIPAGFPALNIYFNANRPTEYGVELGEKLFHDPRLSTDNTVSCASCHIQSFAFGDNLPKAIGVEGRVGLRNSPPIQNLAFMKFYNWDGSKLKLENQPLVPIITHEEMASSMSEVIAKIQDDPAYKDLFFKTFGDEDVTSDRIFKSIAQFEYSLVSADSKYDRVTRDQTESFTAEEANGYEIFQNKCSSCHNTALFTDQSFRNIGFPLNPDPEEAGRARVTGNLDELMSFRVPSLRNVEYTAPYGSFGQFATLKDVLDYMDNGVLDQDNLDPIFKDNDNRIPMTEQEKSDLIAFMKTLSDAAFVGR